LNVAVAI